MLCWGWFLNDFLPTSEVRRIWMWLNAACFDRFWGTRTSKDRQRRWRIAFPNTSHWPAPVSPANYLLFPLCHCSYIEQVSMHMLTYKPPDLMSTRRLGPSAYPNFLTHPIGHIFRAFHCSSISSLMVSAAYKEILQGWFVRFEFWTK